LWTRTYGGGNDDISYSLQITADEGYIISAKTTSFGAGGNDAYLIKTDAGGDTLWTRTYGGTGTDKGYFVQLTPGGDYIMTGETTSYGGGDYDVLLIKVGGEVTGIEDDQPILARPCVIAQNYPNPFNPSTVISYELLQVSDVSMNIYDLSGRRVKTLVSGIQAAGAHRATWDGRNDMGEAAACGVYVCRLDVRGYVQVRKMVLTR
ncbi:T9SS type A sorting domain-containing protein, partial [bacterium]|nr:T9SS type A sorting domain-containing protein [bacterium]